MHVVELKKTLDTFNFSREELFLAPPRSLIHKIGINSKNFYVYPLRCCLDSG